jgi:Polyketide cyclase / dehydrase and lipid transport
MASIYKDIPIDAHPDKVWDAVRDFGAVHQRLNPGFVVDCRLDGNARIVTFHNGNVVREDFVDCGASPTPSPAANASVTITDPCKC